MARSLLEKLKMTSEGYIIFAPTWGIYFVLRFTCIYVIAIYFEKPNIFFLTNEGTYTHVNYRISYGLKKKEDDAVLFSMHIFSLNKRWQKYCKRHRYIYIVWCRIHKKKRRCMYSYLDTINFFYNNVRLLYHDYKLNNLFIFIQMNVS